MHNEPPMAQIGALIGTPARAQMLTELFDGRALTATELANVAGVTPATASEHLSMLLQGGLVVREKSGRHNYYSLAGEDIAMALEELVVLISVKPTSQRTGSFRQNPIQHARLCYDHLAGNLGVQIAESLVNKNLITVVGRDYKTTGEGDFFFGELGISIAQIKSQNRLFARRCLDWSERRHHVAGALGAAFTDMALDRKWVSRTSERRVIAITKLGQKEFQKHLGIEFKNLSVASGC